MSVRVHWAAEAVTVVGRRVFLPSAREVFALLKAKRDASRPVSKKRERYIDSETGKTRYRVVETVGAPTFRNVINEAGEHV